MTPPGFSSPDASAASTIFSAIRSFTDPPGLRYSTLASTVAAMPSVTEFSRTRGVLPTRSTMCSANFIRSSFHALRPSPPTENPERAGSRSETMATMDDYLEVNRLNWDERAPAHAASADYGFERFVADPEHLSDVVAYDRELLGDVSGLTGIHLQCHIGTDTLSLSRLGARMTGLDLSPVSLEQARRWRPTPAPTSTTSRPTPTPRRRRSAGAPSTSSTPASAHCAGCRTSTGGRASSTTCSSPAAGCSCARPPDDVGRRRARTDAVTLGYSYFETPEPFDLEEAGTYVESDVEFVNTARCRGTTASARPSPPC